MVELFKPSASGQSTAAWWAERKEIWTSCLRRVSAAPEGFHQLDSPSAWELVLVSLFLTVVSYVALGANLFRGEIVAPMDLLLSGEAWPDELHTEDILDGDKPDILDAWLPRWIHMKSRLREGELPLWNPYIAGGQPAFPLLFDSYISPSFLLFWLLPDGLGYTLGLMMRLFIAGLGTFLLCRLSLPTLCSVFGAVTFMLCGFNLSWLMWPQVATSCWIPWVVWSFVRLMSRPSARGMGLLAITTALMIFGGFPAVAGFVLYLVVLVFLWMLVSVPEHRPRILRLALVTGYAILLGFLLTGFQLLPGIEYLKTVDLSWRRAWSIPIEKLPFLFFPFKGGYNPHPELTGYVGWTAMLLSPLALLGWRWKGALSSLFWAGVAALSLILIYDFPSFIAELFYRLPVFNMNPVGRLFAVFGLATAVLGAEGCFFFRRLLSIFSLPGWVLPAVPVLLIFVQTGDLMRVGWAENAVVADETFFPKTDLIRHLRGEITPGQGVLHTHEALRFPGILTAYGLQDWYAHTHRLPHEKELLDCVVRNPWVTSTAGLLDYQDIRFESPCLSIFSVRCVVASNPPAALLHWRAETPLRLLPGERAEQSFKLEHPTRVSGAKLITATGGVSVPAEAIRVGIRDANGHELLPVVPASRPISANGSTVFRFPERDLAPGPYVLGLEVSPSAPPGGLYIWIVDSVDSYPDGSFVLDGKPVGDAAFALLGERLDLDGRVWSRRTIDKAVVYENRDAAPGAFYSQSLNPAGVEEVAADGVTPLHFSPEQVTYRLNANSSGWFVRSARVWPGWRVYVNGEAAEIKPFMNLMPAVRVPAGVSEIEYRYDPRSWRVGGIVSLAGLAVLLWLFLSPAARRFPNGA